MEGNQTMAFDEMLENVVELWSEWNTRGFIILSLSLQAFLILFSPLRKRTSNMIISLLIWMAYLSADWVAAFLVGHIATTRRDTSTNHEGQELTAFWAAFLLVHLGGPGTITALNLEDNSLWIRHLFSLVLQAGTISYIFVRVMPSSRLAVPTILVFISGIIKYSERTASLYLASTGKLKDSMLKDSLKLMDKEIKESYDFGEGDLRDDEIVRHAYHLYEVSRGVIVDLIISFDEQHKIRKFFQRMKPEQALELISVELNFFYDVLYTKARVSHSSLGLLFHCLSLGTVTAAALWFVQSNKDVYSKFDVKLSYALLFVAIAFDGIGLLKMFFSDWPIPKIATFGKPSRAGSRTKSYLTIQKSPNWVPHKTNSEPITHSLAETRVVFRRWSESVSQYSLISHALRRPSVELYITFDQSCFAWLCLFLCILYCLRFFMKMLISVLLDKLANKAEAILGKEPTQSIKNLGISASHALKTGRKFVSDKLGITKLRDRLEYVSKVPIPKELWGFIFTELKNKSELAEDPSLANHIIRAKGGFVVHDLEFRNECKEMSDIIEKLDFDEVVLLWHIATELLYHSDFYEESGEGLVEEDRIFGKILSDYMSYLLVKKPTMLSTVAGAGQIRYRDASTDTCAVAKQYLENHHDNSSVSVIISQCCGSKATTVHGLVCRNIIKYYEDRLSSPKVHKSNSVWSDSCRLARALKPFDRKRRWSMIAKIWVEVLSYAASHCKGEAHAQALGSGGELITIVWLLMAHIGLSHRRNIAIAAADRT